MTDPAEADADRAAAAVMSGRPVPAPRAAPTAPAVRRKCDACAHEDNDSEDRVVRRTCDGCGQVAAESVPGTSDAAHIDATRGRGLVLDPASRGFFETRFDRPFGDVKLHAGGDDAAVARRFGASAFTVGSDIYFGTGRYAPASEAGRHLLAHELAHVVQASGTIRRAPSDFVISDLPVGAAGDSDRVYFEPGSATIPVAEQPKIAPLAAPAGQDLTLHAFASEEAVAVDRATRTADRLAAVGAALRGAGHTGAQAPVAHPDEGVGDIDYRHRRSVHVIPTPAGVAAAPNPVDPCSVPGSGAASGQVRTDCESAFTAAFPTARAAAAAALRDVVTTPTAAAGALVGRFFAGVPRADIDRNVRAIAAQVSHLPGHHRCRTACDGGCDRPAYNEGTGVGASGARVSICPDFVGATPDFQSNTLIHEAAHGNPVEVVDDIAYSNTRLIPFLLPADSRRNTDSYVVLFRLVHTAGSVTVGPAAPDVVSGMVGAGPGSDTEQAARAVAWLESWLNYGDFDTGILYETVVASLAQPGHAWVTAGTNEFNIQTMHRLATAFSGEFTDPGADGAARTTPPTEQDKVRVAAIHDRFDQMYDIVNQQVLTVTRGAAEGWQSQPALPLLTQSVTVEPSFFGLSDAERVKHLVRLMVRARRDVSSAFEEKYVTVIDLIRVHRGLGA